MSAPLLGVAGAWGAAEIELARRFDDLHQLLYRRGGLRPSNAVVEEIAKLVLIRFHSPSLFDAPSVPGFRAAFAAALADPALTARDPEGHEHPLWPDDEPFRIADEALLAEAAAVVATIVGPDRPTVADPLGTAFDALLAGRHDHAGGLGTYLTPSAVARMMASVAVPLLRTSPSDDGPGFGDPYCGTGRFLVALLEVLAGEPLGRAGPFGADVSASAVAKARINMLLYGVNHPLVWTVRDSVTDSTLDKLLDRVPLILTNPPFGEGKYDDPAGLAATARDLPSLAGRGRIDPSLACLVRSLRLLAPGGVLGIVLPDGVTTGRPFEELVLGDDGPLAGEVSLAAAVSLPTATFSLSGTVAKTSALFLRRRATNAQATNAQAPNAQASNARRPNAETPARVALARVSHVGYLRQAGRPAPDPLGSQLPQVTADLTAALTTGATPPGSLVVLVDTVRTLDPSRLDPDALAARQSLVDSGGVELREYLAVVPPPRARQITTPFVSVLHVDDLGVVDWAAAHAHTPSTPGLRVAAGDVIVSLLNPAKLRATVLPVSAQASAEFGVFRAFGDPYAILGLLYAPRVRAQLRPLGTGTSSSRRRIDADDILSLIVPKLDPATLDTLATTIRHAHHTITTARTHLHTTYESPQDPVDHDVSSDISGRS